MACSLLIARDESSGCPRTVTGYLHPSYAQSLAAFGEPRRLEASGGTILARRVPGTGSWDAIGPYPIFACRDWSLLRDDVDALRGQLVALALVADPFGGFTEPDLRAAFRDHCVRFKDHFEVDLSVDLDEHVHPHHRRNAAAALRSVEVRQRPDPPALLPYWCELYAALVERHGIRGLAAFSRDAFAAQLRVPGMVAFEALQGGEIVGINLWYTHGDVAYYHLGAYSDAGYRLRASFALFRRALEHFADAGARWSDLGAGAGVVRSGDDGLSRFKRGWATGTRPAYLCGAILDPDAYRALTANGGRGDTGYFPAYREGEFG